MEQTGGCQIHHARNGREYRPPELPHYSVDGYCRETLTDYEFLGYYYNGCTCQPFRDVKTMGGETLAERFEQTMARIEQITRAGYLVKIQWERQFDEPQIAEQKPEFLAHPIVRRAPDHPRCSVRGSNRSHVPPL